MSLDTLRCITKQNFNTRVSAIFTQEKFQKSSLIRKSRDTVPLSYFINLV